SYMLKYRPSDRTLVVATHGRGLFTTTIPTVATAVNTVLNTKGFINYISVNQNSLFVKAGTLTTTKTMQVNIVDMQGRLLSSNKLGYGSQTIAINQLPKGAYVIKITGDKKEQYTQQFVK
ncbi:MAG: T9SS type A sorting domain-containing protein, partial [Chitinophagaceae bacterium]|nr:T9SS type A sorting domain-containing protein [Chitinophagaceae bacterium]